MKMKASLLSFMVALTFSGQASAYIVTDFPVLTAAVIEMVEQAVTTVIQDRFGNYVDKQLEVVGEAGAPKMDGSSCFSSGENELEDDNETLTVGVKALGLEGKDVKNTTKTQSVIKQTMIVSTEEKDLKNFTVEDENNVRANQKTVKTDLALQGLSKSSVDKTNSSNTCDSQIAAGLEMINAVETEREALQAHAQVTISMAEAFSDLVEKNAANLAVISSGSIEGSEGSEGPQESKSSAEGW